MDSRERTLDIGMAKRRVIAFGSAKIGKPFEATKRRPRIISSCRSPPLFRLIIPPQRRDRWFKSSPATNFSAAGAYRVYVIQNREGKFYIGLSDDVDLRRLRGWRVRVIRFSLIRQRIQVTESESIDAGNAPALHLCRCREKLAREIAVYRMQ